MIELLKMRRFMLLAAFIPAAFFSIACGLPEFKAGEIHSDDDLRRELVDSLWLPPSSEAAFRVVLAWGNDRYSFTEIIKKKGGERHVVAFSDIGTTLFHVAYDSENNARVERNIMNMPDRTLIETLAFDASMTVEFGKMDNAVIIEFDDGRKALRCTDENETRLFFFDDFNRLNGIAVGDRKKMHRYMSVKQGNNNELQELSIENYRWDYTAEMKLVKYDSPNTRN